MLDFPNLTDSLAHDPDATAARAAWLHETAQASLEHLNRHVDVFDWIASFQVVRERVLRLVWEATIPQEIRRDVVYIRFGSSGRREDLLTSDLDHAVVTRDDMVVQHLLPHVHTFIARMNDFGCPVCQGFVMSTNPRWSGTVSSWQNRIQSYFQFPDWENVRYLFITLDGRPLYDERDVWEPIHEPVFDGIRTSPFICWEMAHLGIHKSVALDLFGRIRAQAGVGREAIHLKDGLITPILHSVRLLAIADGFPVVSTQSRMDHLRTRSLVPEDLHRRTAEALQFAIRTRLHKQIDDVLSGRDPSDVVAIGREGTTGLVVRRDELIQHLETAKQLERFTHRQFRKPR